MYLCNLSYRCLLFLDLINLKLNNKDYSNSKNTYLIINNTL